MALGSVVLCALIGSASDAFWTWFVVGVFWAIVVLLLLALEERQRGSLRRRVTGDHASAGDLRRGDQVRAVSRTPRIGIVCTELWDFEQPAMQAGSIRVTKEDTLFEHWIECDAQRLPHEVVLAIPRDAPFSYEGDCISYAWSISASRPGHRGRERRTESPIWVLP